MDQDNTYLFRYRVISEDKNRVSHWSQFLRVAGPAIDPLGYNGAINVTTKDININWYDTPRRGSYDIFVKYGVGTPLLSTVWGSYQYAGTSSTQSFTILNNVTGKDFIGVLVQVSGNKTLNNNLEIFEGTSTLRAEIDGGNASGV